ncbi:dihydrofolate reductase family protein [Nonomuraea sp. NPDC059194]|uniref:dihydrofolate reductase family protein n=1 Tax=Nonomuraea sp. NPDC059194 TaxID=3346764 RepID=UPI0036A908E0
MRKIVAQLFVSVDGVMQAPEDWHFPYYDERMAEVVAEQFHQSDILLLGRTTYQVFAGSWPEHGSEVPLADRINTMPKLVASTTLNTVAWQNSTLISGTVADELTKLKQQPGRNITIAGSPTLVRSLLHDDVLDELQLLVHPVVLGHGRRLFEEDDLNKSLRLAGSEVFRTGVVHLTYQPAVPQ